MAFVSIQDVQFQYPAGDFSLFISTLEVDAAETAAVVGPSGSGKTTLLNLISGVDRPNAGSVCVADQVLSEMSDTARRNFRIARIGFIFQDFGLIEYLDVFDNIIHPFRLSGALRLTSDIKEKARELVSEIGLQDRLHHRPAELSHGEKQRVAICRALLPEPDLILADEATGNLDPDNKDHILDLLLQQVKQRGATLMAVTHDMDLISRFDRVIDFNMFRAKKAA